ncbi:MAG: SH3 domain-containing protein [Deltaproteobacteria bacterium]|nr:SH3 domain-containing protein [Deltaproteobacteria bacterium]
MFIKLGLLMSLILPWSCSNDDQAAKEPVSTEAKAPDAPGADSGEGVAKPAGVGTVEAVAASAEKSEPATDVAKDAVPSPVAAFIVKPKQLNVRKGPSTDDPVVRKLNQGDKVEALSCEKSWCKIAESEFVSERFLKKAK